MRTQTRDDETAQKRNKIIRIFFAINNERASCRDSNQSPCTVHLLELELGNKKRTAYETNKYENLS